jgi:hypothetical protein
MHEDQTSELEAEYRSYSSSVCYAGVVSLIVLAVGALFYHGVQHLSWVGCLVFLRHNSKLQLGMAILCHTRQLKSCLPRAMCWLASAFWPFS